MLFQAAANTRIIFQTLPNIKIDKCLHGAQNMKLKSEILRTWYEVECFLQSIVQNVEDVLLLEKDLKSIRNTAIAIISAAQGQVY